MSLTSPAGVFPFFVGCGRSGTTLLRSIFDAHPDIAIPRESYFIADLAPLRGAYELPGGFNTGVFQDDLERHAAYRQWGLERSHVDDTVGRGGGPIDFPDAVRRVFGAYASSQGKLICGDKTPSYVLHLPLLAALFPEAKFVHLVRDGRDVALSFRETPFGPTTIEEAALHWRSRVSRGRRAGQQLGANRYREVRYENLIDDPEGTARSLCDFLGLDFQAEMLRYQAKTGKFVASSVHPGTHRHLLAPPTKGLREWRQQMPALQAERFDVIAGDALEEFGYERASVRPALRAKAGAWGRRVPLEIRRAHRRKVGRGSGWWW